MSALVSTYSNSPSNSSEAEKHQRMQKPVEFAENSNREAVGMELFLENYLQAYRIGGFLWFVYVLPLYICLKSILYLNYDVKRNTPLERLTNSSVFL